MDSHLLKGFSVQQWILTLQDITQSASLKPKSISETEQPASRKMLNKQSLSVLTDPDHHYKP